MQETTGQRIRRLRIAKGLPRLFDLVTTAGIPEQTIRRWEDDECLPSAEYLPRLAESLDTTTDYILTGKEPSYEHSAP